MTAYSTDQLEEIFAQQLPYSERGGVLLSADDGGMFFANWLVQDELLLWLYFIPSNYPSFRMGSRRTTTVAEREAIRADFAGWNVLKDNFNLPLDSSGCVLGLDKE